MPNFNAGILKQYIEVFNEGAKKLVQEVQKEVGKEEFDIQKYFYNNMLSTLLGKYLFKIPFGLVVKFLLWLFRNVHGS